MDLQNFVFLFCCTYVNICILKKGYEMLLLSDTDDSQRKSMNNITEKSEMSNTTVLECLSVLTMEEI